VSDDRFELEGTAARNGLVAAGLREEYPALGLLVAELDVVPGRSPVAVRGRLRDMSSRFSGPEAVVMRQRPIPHAYRVFYRHVGLEPDTVRPPGEAAALRRLVAGEFRSENIVDDALTIALVETGVPVWALDALAVEGDLGLRLSGAGERLGVAEGAPRVPADRIVVADARAPLAVLFGDIAAGHGVTRDTRRMTLFTVTVPGVPAIAVEEALWTCASVLRS
jgi:DNA/RNA-binding domain of Phe-tRNA-synthetase-like protein